MANQGRADIVMNDATKKEEKSTEELKILKAALEIFKLQPDPELEDFQSQNQAFIQDSKALIDSFESLLTKYKTVEKTFLTLKKTGEKLTTPEGKSAFINAITEIENTMATMTETKDLEFGNIKGLAFKLDHGSIRTESTNTKRRRF